MSADQKKIDQLEEHIQFLKKDSVTLRMVGNSKLCKAVGIDAEDIETVRMLTEVLFRKMALIGKFDHLNI